MIITTKLSIDMQNNVPRPVISAVQNDSNSRAIEFLFYSGCTPWTIPDGITAALSYSKPDGTAGIYDKLPDGAEAFSISGTAISAIMAPQMLTVPGEVKAAIVLSDANSTQLSTFPFIVNVVASPNPGKIVSENYCYYTNLDAINEAINALQQAVGGSSYPTTTEITEESTDKQVPTAKAVYDYVTQNSSGSDSGGNVDLTGYATEQWVQNQKYLTEVPEGYAKTTDIPTKPEDIGALPDTYTPPNQTAEQVGADLKGTAASAVSQHNTADDSHNDIRLELKAINDRLTAFFDSDNQTLDELSEIVSYITSNKSLIDAITTSKVSVADIINNLTTNVGNKPLSAAQGVVLKGLIDTLSGNLANYQPKGDYALRSEIPAVPTKVSAFTNDAGYMTGDDKDNIISEVSTNETLIDTVADNVKAVVPLVKTAEQPAIVNSIDEMTDPTKVYVMPDGYLYGYREIENYNLFKLSEVSASMRLQDDSTELISSKSNHTTGWIPVEHGKYYSFSALFPDGVRLAYETAYYCKLARWNVKYTDGTVAALGNTIPWVSGYENKAFAITSEDIAAIRLQFAFWYKENGKTTAYETSTLDDIRAFEPMLVAGNTAAEALENALNLEYIDGDVEAIAEWYNTGLAYNQPADYEDRIIKLETAQIEHEERIDKLENQKHAELALQGKKWTVIGDSHTEQNSCATKRYYDYIAENTGISVTVNGIGGTGYKNGEANSKAYYHRVLNISADTDVVTLFTSNNDLLLGAEIGTYTDTTTDTICGCINKTIDNLFSVLPTVKLGIITNMPGSSYNPMSTDENAGENLANAVVELCRRRGIPCLDLFHSSGLRPWDANFKELCYKHDPNKGHFDEDGHAFIAPRIKSLLESIIM